MIDFTLGFCFWDLPALLILIGVVAFFAVQHQKYRRDAKELEEELSGRWAGNSTNKG